MTRRTKRERGVAMVLSALFLTAVIAMSAIAIEVSRLTDTATEVQVAADAAALAAAQKMIDGGDTASATVVGRAVAAQNRTDGRDPTDVAIEFGIYAPAGGFDPAGGTNPNAVRATVAIPNVRYIFATVFGHGASTTVTKRAVATYECSGSRHPTAPVTICDCALKTYSQGQQCSGTANPPLTQTPNGSQNSCWLANPPDASGWFPPECGGGSSPLLSVGDSVELKNGQMVPILRDFQRCMNSGVTDFVIPVIKCSATPCAIGNCNHSGEVTGFATISLSAVNATGGGWIQFSQICNNDAAGTGGNTGSGGAVCFGSGHARLVDDRAGT